MENTNQTVEKNDERLEKKIEVIVAILLGVTALFSAWATWMGGLHSGNQSANFTESNNLSSESNSEYVMGLQTMTQDMMTWKELNDLILDQAFADSRQEEKYDEKIKFILENNCSETFGDAINWALEQKEDGSVSPFEKEGYVETYFATADSLSQIATEKLEQGKKDSTSGDSFGLVNVIYTIVLFLLGIIGVFKRLPNRKVVLISSAVLLLIATIYMLTLPLPTGFSFASFF